MNAVATSCFAAEGFEVVHIPFRWERMQPTLDGELDTALLGHLTDLAARARSKGLAAQETAQQYGGFREKLMAPFAADDQVFFRLLNVPHEMAIEHWLTDASSAVAGICSAGHDNPVFVPSIGWTAAHSWTTDGSPPPTKLGVVDPANNFLYEIHQYLDGDSSGTSATCVGATIGS